MNNSTTTTTSKGLRWGPFTLRIPFVHIKFRAGEFFQGMVGTLTAGGQLKLFFLNRAEHYMRENRTRLQMFLESIALLAESYIVVAVAMPLFLIVMLVIMFWVSGSGAQMSEGMLYGIVLGFVPMIHIAYAILVWTSSKEQDM